MNDAGRGHAHFRHNPKLAQLVPQVLLLLHPIVAEQGRSSVAGRSRQFIVPSARVTPFRLRLRLSLPLRPRRVAH